MKRIVLFIVLSFTMHCNAQALLQVRNNNDPLNEGVKKYNDSISKIKIESDTITKYKIEKIVDDESFYIIYAKGMAKDGKEYFYRIKSLKVKVKRNCKELIKTGKSYQLDLRDYKNHNQRLHFIPGASLNLITHYGFSPFDIIVHLDEKITQDEFNVALNLEGLYLTKKDK